MSQIRRIPPIEAGRPCLEAIKENLEVITGQRVTPLALVDTAGMTGNDLILAQKINEIVSRLQ
jgi:hypothetical protein